MKQYVVIGNDLDGVGRMRPAFFDPSEPLEPQLREFAETWRMDASHAGPGLVAIEYAVALGGGFA